jgi:hypothetical protein
MKFSVAACGLLSALAHPMDPLTPLEISNALTASRAGGFPFPDW